jgi:replicative DNA helicase
VDSRRALGVDAVNADCANDKLKMERLPVGVTLPKSAFEVSIAFDEHLKNASANNLLPISTGFAELDEILGGGLHPESLMLVGGPPGVGKTIFVMQAARNIAASGEAIAWVVCFEHGKVYLYQRLLCMERRWVETSRTRLR